MPLPWGQSGSTEELLMGTKLTSLWAECHSPKQEGKARREKECVRGLKELKSLNASG